MGIKSAIFSVSVFASLALTNDGNIEHYNYSQTLDNYKEYSTSILHGAPENKTKIKYEELCKSVSYMLKMASFQICEIRTIEPGDSQILKDFLSLIKSSKQVAECRVKEMGLDADKEVLYSLVATEHIVEAVLDRDFFEITGGYKMPSDFISFGKEILSATTQTNKG